MNDNLLIDVLNATKNIVNASNEILDSLLKNPVIKAKIF